MKRNYYYAGREWQYNEIKPRIIAEEYMEDEATHELRDYKFFCFDGVVKAMFIAMDRQSKTPTTFDFFDENFNHLDIVQVHPMSEKKILKPQNFELMKDIASKLSKGFPHLRVDLYNINGRIYFGELTFFHHGGMVPFHPESWDYTFGSWLKLPQY